MADTQTPNYSLTNPEVGGSEDDWGAKHNANLDMLDIIVHDNEESNAAASGEVAGITSRVSALSALVGVNTTKIGDNSALLATNQADSQANALDVIAAGQDVVTNSANANANAVSIDASAVSLALEATRFVSSEQVVLQGTLLTLPHGLAAAPAFISFKLINKVAQAGYSVGDTIFVSVVNNTRSTSGGSADHFNSVWSDSTNIYVRFTNQLYVFTTAHKDTGDYVLCIPERWKLIVSARL